MLNSDNFILIQGWMVTDLKLKGLDLMIFAIIYSFSQDPQSSFSGSISYLMEWTNASNLGVRKSLQRLLTANLIRKEVSIQDGVRRCIYDYNPITVRIFRQRSS